MEGLTTPTSHNGWTVVDNDSPRLRTLPGITGKVLAGDVWLVFRWLVEQYSVRVEPIKASDSWGHNKRKIRGGSNAWSNHSSATAIDLNSSKHPFLASGTMTRKQAAACRQIVAESGGVLKWLEGHDEMHWEIRPGVTPAQVKAFARTITEKESATMAELSDAFKERILRNPEDPAGRRWSVEDYLYSIRRQANVSAKRAAKILAKLDAMPAWENYPDTAAQEDKR